MDIGGFRNENVTSRLKIFAPNKILVTVLIFSPMWRSLKALSKIYYILICINTILHYCRFIEVEQAAAAF